MIPFKKSLKLIKVEPVLSNYQEEFYICDVCSKEITVTQSFVLIVEKSLTSYIVCETCGKLKKCDGNKVIFLDTLEFYQKRLKSGFIEQFLKEYKDAS